MVTQWSLVGVVLAAGHHFCFCKRAWGFSLEGITREDAREEKGPAIFTCDVTKLKAITSHESSISALQCALEKKIEFWKKK